MIRGWNSNLRQLTIESFPFSKGGQAGFFRSIVMAWLVLCLCSGHPAGAYGGESKSSPEGTAAAQQDSNTQSEAGAMPSADAALVQEDPSKVQQGDLVELKYALFLEDGSLISTNIPDAANDPALKKAAQYAEPQTFSAEKVIAGQPTPLMGLRDAVLGMTVKERRRIVLPPEKAYGERDLQKVEQISCSKTMPKTVRMSPEEWVKNFNSFPVAGKEFWFNPFFPARVVEVNEQEVLLEFQKEGQIPQSELGSVSVSMDDNNVTLTLTPVIGAHFGSNGQDGRITESDGKQFTVDFNNPLAGRSLVLDAEVVSLTKKSAFKGMEISWLEDYDKGLEAAERENKPMVLVLYADRCPLCNQLMSHTLKDQRVKVLKDRFVWVKVNADKEVKCKKLYSPKVYPTIVFLDSKGQVLKRHGSSMNGWALSRELDPVPGGGTPAEAVPKSLFYAGIPENLSGRWAPTQNPPWPPWEGPGESLSSFEPSLPTRTTSKVGRRF
jgi:FKBP-type peptidyl-prolyl cis-trans isomerase 2